MSLEVLKFNNTFLNPLEEKFFKSGFQEFLDYNEIDQAIRPLIKAINSIHGIASLYCCYGHESNNHYGYVALKYSAEIAYAFDEYFYVLNSLPGNSIDWDEELSYEVMGVPSRIGGVTILRGYDRKSSDLIFEMLGEFISSI